jgi:hypothetical protein
MTIKKGSDHEDNPKEQELDVIHLMSYGLGREYSQLSKGPGMSIAENAHAEAYATLCRQLSPSWHSP